MQADGAVVSEFRLASAETVELVGDYPAGGRDPKAAQAVEARSKRDGQGRQLPLLDRVNLIGDKPVGFPVNRVGGLRVGRVDKAEHLPGLVVNPVVDVPHVVLVLGLEVSLVGGSHILRRRSLWQRIVNIHEQRHVPLLGFKSSMWGRSVDTLTTNRSAPAAG